ncbi:MAG: DUF883 C-terminal domain-containing protein [Desulforhopalus sp.]
MKNYSRVVDKDGNTIENPVQSTRSEGTECTGIEKAQKTIADKLENFAGTVSEKTASRDEQSKVSSYGQEASEILHQSAEYIREFDYEKTDADIRGYIEEQPGRSLLIAGGVGLLIGFFLRRR